MSKVASIFSIEFETPEEVADFTKYVASKHDAFSPDLEQLTQVRTSDTSVMVIQVHPNQDSFDHYESVFQKVRDENPVTPKDWVKLQGPVTYMFHHTKYLNV